MLMENIIKLLNELRKYPDELPWLEFKTNIAEQKASITYEGVGEYISGMANSACIRYKDYAYLVLGVEDATWKCGIPKVVSACCYDITACLSLADQVICQYKIRIGPVLYSRRGMESATCI